jgi:hypothetical protein
MSLIAIGDVHGDLDALVRILLGAQLVDQEGHWAGRDTELVLMGDLNDRGPESVNVMDFVMAIQGEALATGGVVHALLGNHELLAARQDHRYVWAREYLAFEHFWFGDVNGLNAIYGGDSPYAQWLRRRPTIVCVASTAFVHAGLNAWTPHWTVSDLNRIVSQWIAAAQGVGETPDEDTAWTVEEDGPSPLWMHRFTPSPAAHASDEDRAALNGWLAHLGVERLVVGHMVTRALDFAIAYPHQEYKEAVACIDTGISRSFGGRLSAVEIDGSHIRAHYFDRGTDDTPTTLVVRAACEQHRQSFGTPDA